MLITVICPAELCEGINEARSPVGFVLAEFTGLIVPGENVMIIVPALAECCNRHEKILYWTDVPEKQKKKYIN